MDQSTSGKCQNARMTSKNLLTLTRHKYTTWSFLPKDAHGKGLSSAAGPSGHEHVYCTWSFILESQGEKKTSFSRKGCGGCMDLLQEPMDRRWYNGEREELNHVPRTHKAPHCLGEGYLHDSSPLRFASELTSQGEAWLTDKASSFSCGPTGDEGLFNVIPTDVEQPPWGVAPGPLAFDLQEAAEDNFC